MEGSNWPYARRSDAGFKASLRQVAPTIKETNTSLDHNPGLDRSLDYCCCCPRRRLQDTIIYNIYNIIRKIRTHGRVARGHQALFACAV